MWSWYDVSITARERRADFQREAEQSRMLARSGHRRNTSLWEKFKKRLATRVSPPRRRRKAASHPPHQEAPEILAI